jgi:CSLREA domain-containing protein
MSHQLHSLRIFFSQSIRFRAVFAAFAFLIFLSAAQGAHAATFTVNNNGDAFDANPGNGICETAAGNGICTLRAAVQEANAFAGDDVINVAAGISTITLTSGTDISITSNLTINGTGANQLTINGGTGLNRIFSTDSATVTIRGVTLTGGNGVGTGNPGLSFGGAIYANGGTLTLDSVVVTGNTTTNTGGGLYIFGGTNHVIRNSTFSNNFDAVACGAIRLDNASTLIVNSTISGNEAPEAGGTCTLAGGTTTFRNSTVTNNSAFDATFSSGGVYVEDGGTVNLGNTIVAGNTSRIAPDIRNSTTTPGTITTSGGNLIGNNTGANAPAFAMIGAPNANGDYVGTNGSVINPLLGPLQNNGGTTPTHALMSNSPAIDRGINALATAAGLTTDQRGFARIVDGDLNGTAIVDIGSFEFAAAPTAATAVVGGRAMSLRKRGISNARITLTDASGNIRMVMTNSFGYYRFEDVEAGSTYIITATAKNFTFPEQSQVLYVTGDTDSIDFLGYPQ